MDPKLHIFSTLFLIAVIFRQQDASVNKYRSSKSPPCEDCTNKSTSQSIRLYTAFIKQRIINQLQNMNPAAIVSGLNYTSVFSTATPLANMDGHVSTFVSFAERTAKKKWINFNAACSKNRHKHVTKAAKIKWISFNAPFLKNRHKQVTKADLWIPLKIRKKKMTKLQRRAKIKVFFTDKKTERCRHFRSLKIYDQRMNWVRTDLPLKLIHGFRDFEGSVRIMLRLKCSKCGKAIQFHFKKKKKRSWRKIKLNRLRTSKMKVSGPFLVLQVFTPRRHRRTSDRRMSARTTVPVTAA